MSKAESKLSIKIKEKYSCPSGYSLKENKCYEK